MRKEAKYIQELEEKTMEIVREIDEGLEKIKVKDAKQAQQITRNIDKLERLGIDEVSKLLKSGRKDSSGAFQPGCNLSDNQVDEILNIDGEIKCKTPVEISIIPKKINIAHSSPYIAYL